MALSKTTEEIREFYPARITFDHDDLLPALNEVEQEYLAEQVLGQALYDQLHSAYQDNDLDSDEEELVAKCRAVSANMAIYRYTGVGNVEFTSGGLMTGGSEHNKPASEWRTVKLEKTLLRSAHRALDVLVNWLVLHVDAFPEWEGTELHTRLNTGFLRTTAQFDEVVRIGNSGYLFRQMIPAVKCTEQGAVLATLCDKDYRDTLIAAINAETLTAEQGRVVELVRKATAHIALASSISQLALQTDEDGVWTFNSLIGGSTSGGPTAASASQLNQRIEQEQAIGRGFLDELRNELQAQAVADSNHPYRSSPCYVDPNAVVAPRFEQDGPVGGFLA